MIEAQLITSMAWGRHQLVCHVAKVKCPNIDAFTSKAQGFFTKTQRFFAKTFTGKTRGFFAKTDKGFVDFVRDPHISVFTPFQSP